ncbi:hypothetical protein BJ878DRAFT_415989 [Calycina marina]|uniref:Uncharacterized protein n=1 Tax=Calycina marina TaxID=1763456 RepID=A0A9P7Z8J9_9HELO|nr:hypothetical protein BJ878DRAFT_415989 [Calycina marina]
MAVALSKAQRLAARTVHIKMYPSARNFQERREVLRVLERFGEVNIFRSLKYHPTSPVADAFIAIFGADSAATNIINASPVRYRIINQSGTSTEISSAADSQPGVTAAPEAKERVFEININKSFHDHERYIKEQPLYGPWKPVETSSSFMAASLAEAIPSSPMTSGLSDWVTAQQKYRKDDIKEQMILSDGSKNHFSLAFQSLQKHQAQLKKDIPLVMKGISGFRHQIRAGSDSGTQDEGSNSIALSTEDLGTAASKEGNPRPTNEK